MKKILVIALLLLVFNHSFQLEAANLIVKTKVKFKSCQELKDWGRYRGEGNYTLYDEQGEPYQAVCENLFTSCKDILNYQSSTGDGVYNIVNNGQEYPVYCDMTTLGGGWTMVLAQFETNPISWDEGIQSDYNPSLSTSQSFALNNSEIPEHKEISYGKNLSTNGVNSFYFNYNTGDIPVTALKNINDGLTYYIHRNLNNYYSYHNPEDSIRSPGVADWRNTLTINKSGTLYTYAFSPRHPIRSHRGYSYNGSHITTSNQSYAWTLWVR